MAKKKAKKVAKKAKKKRAKRRTGGQKVKMPGVGSGNNPASRKGMANLDAHKAARAPRAPYSLTAILKRVMKEETLDNRTGDPITRGEKMIRTAMLQSELGEFKYFQELFNRIEGKVPDAIILQNAQEMVKQQAVQIALKVADIAEQVAGNYMDEESCDEFVMKLGEKLLEEFAKEDTDEDMATDGDTEQ